MATAGFGEQEYIDGGCVISHVTQGGGVLMGDVSSLMLLREGGVLMGDVSSLMLLMEGGVLMGDVSSLMLLREGVY